MHVCVCACVCVYTVCVCAFVSICVHTCTEINFDAGKNLDQTPVYPASFKLPNTITVGAIDEVCTQ